MKNRLRTPGGAWPPIFVHYAVNLLAVAIG